MIQIVNVVKLCIQLPRERDNVVYWKTKRKIKLPTTPVRSFASARQKNAND